MRSRDSDIMGVICGESESGETADGERGLVCLATYEIGNVRRCDWPRGRDKMDLDVVMNIFCIIHRRVSGPAAGFIAL